MKKIDNDNNIVERGYKSEGTRRSALRKIGLGSAIVTLATQWQKPKIDSAILPAHAESSEIDS